MREPESKVEALRDLVDVRWTDARAGKVEASIARRRVSRARSRRVLVSVATVCVVSVVGGLGWASLRARARGLGSPSRSELVLPGPPTPSPEAARGAVPASPLEAIPTAEAPAGTAAPEVPSATHAPVAPSGAWRRWAHDGDYDNAFKSLAAAGPAAVKDDTGDLLLASDVARLSGHATDAVGPLRRVLRDHASDPRAPLAAFTLGRVLLDELGRPDEAADAFARARRLAPGGPLEEDALAREVEALSRAGETDKAREAADAYVGRYPGGRRLRSVRRFGGLD